MNNIKETRMPKPPITKGNGATGNKMTEYRAALSIFSDDMLTQVYNLMLNKKSKTDEGDDEKQSTPNFDNNTKQLISVYNKCKASAITISKIEATPGFSQSFSNVSSTNKRSHAMMKNNLLNLNNTKQSSSSSIPRPQIRRGNSAGMKQGDRNTMNKGPTLLRRNVSSNGTYVIGRISKSAPPPHPQLNKSNRNLSSSGNNGRGEDEGIPESALNFLAALNAKKPQPPTSSHSSSLTASRENMKRTKNNSRGRTSKATKKSEDDDEETEKSLSDDEASSSSSGITENDDDDDDEEFESNTTTLLPSTNMVQRRSTRNRAKVEDRMKKQIQKVQKEEENFSSDDEIPSKMKMCKDSNNDRPKRRTRSSKSSSDYNDSEVNRSPKRPRNTKSDENSKDKETKRLLGRTNVVYDIGDEVAVYVEKEEKWYQASIRDIEFKIENESREHEDETFDRPRRRSTRSKASNEKTENHVKVKHYTIEYDNGEVQEFVSPENVMDNLNND